MENKKSSISDYAEYRKFCESAATSDGVFRTFKQSPIYTAILEHASKEQAECCIPLILESGINVDRLEVLKSNDEQGSPTTEIYSNSLFNGMSPSTIRYIKVLADMLDIYSTLDGYNIVEIGVGYGGQCKVLNDYFDINSYELVDLPEVSKLAEKYLDKYEYKSVKLWDNKTDEYDLVISNYAITECSREIQQYYIDNILKKSKHGYITCNYISDRFNIESMHQKEFILAIGLEKYYLIDENPLTFPGNKVLIW
jgi:hypothetical protein